MRNSKKKHSFILLEVLIGIALVSFFAIPLITFPIWQCKSEINSLNTLELEKIANKIYAQTLEDLYANKISWMDMEKTGACNTDHPLKSEFIYYDGKKKEVKIKVNRWSTQCMEYKDSFNTLHFINLKIKMEADFIPLENKAKKKPLRIKLFRYKVLAKKVVQKNQKNC